MDKCQLLQAGEDGLQVDEVERPVADVLPLAQLQKDGVGRLSTNLTLVNFPIQLSAHRIASSKRFGLQSAGTCISRFQSHILGRSTTLGLYLHCPREKLLPIWSS